MSPERVTITGVPETIATLRRIEADASKPPASAAQLLAGSIMAEAPVRTGYLRSSVTVESESSVVILADYGAAVAARDPYIARGADASEKAIADAWERSIAESIRREGAG